MSYASKVDSSQAAIVKGLRQAGLRVEIIKRPVDIMVQTGKNWWRLLEIKTPTKTGKRRSRTDQAVQDQFIEQTGTPVVTTLEEALAALREP